MRKPLIHTHCHLICCVYITVVKGTCQYTLSDIGGVEIHEYKRSKQCQRCQRYSTDFNALNAMYVEDGVCSFYTTLHTEYCYSSYSCQRCQRCQILCTLYTGPLTPPRGKVICYLKSLPSCGFSSSPPVSLRRQLC